MVSGASLATDTLVKVVIQITDTSLNPQQRADEVHDLHQELQALSDLQGARIGILERVTDEGTLQFGVRFAVSGEQVRAALNQLCDRSMPLRLSCWSPSTSTP